jgi:hypothetical protein
VHIFTLAATLALSIAPLIAAQDHAAMNGRGEHVMGFDQNKTSHHFYLYPDGGAIDVLANDASDTLNIAAVRSHLPHIIQMFGSGDFSAPMLVHATNVPGTADLARLKDKIAFSYVETPNGGRVNIVTHDPETLTALYAFLRFQITDHQTGDPLGVARRR